MLASARIRQYASKFASTQPEVAFDLLDLASKVAEDEQGQKDQGQKDQGQAKQAQDDQGQKDQGAKDQGQAKQGGELPPALKEHLEKKKEEAGGDDKKDEQGQGQKQAYAQLKAATIRVANENPGVRSTLLPVLKLIKQLG